MRVFKRPISMELFLYLFDVVRNLERVFTQGYIDLVPESSENLFTPFLIEKFARKFSYVRPHNLVALKKVGKLNEYGGLSSSNFRFRWSFHHFKNLSSSLLGCILSWTKSTLSAWSFFGNGRSCQGDPIINIGEVATAPRGGVISDVLGM